jgi:hypothetical protein
MQNFKEYKPINLSFNIEDDLGIEVLLAEMSTVTRSAIQVLDGNAKSYFSFDPYKKELFVFLKESIIAQKIIFYPEEIISINFSEFEMRSISMKDKPYENAYYHYLYDERKNESLFQEENVLGISNKLQDVVDECILTHHTDMYFTYIYRYIIHIEYEMKNRNSIADINVVYDQYSKLCAHILMKTCNVTTEFYELITKDDIHFFDSRYFDLIEYGKSYSEVISQYIIDRSFDEQIILKELDDAKIFYPKFYRLCMIEGYMTAMKRISENLDSQEYFDFEILRTNQRHVLKFFPTPYGFLMKSKLAELAANDKLDLLINKFLLEYNINRISDPELIKRFKTSYIFNRDFEDGYYYYKKRDFNSSYVEFGEQNRDHPLKALLIQGQMNLEHVSK